MVLVATGPSPRPEPCPSELCPLPLKGMRGRMSASTQPPEGSVYLNSSEIQAWLKGRKAPEVGAEAMVAVRAR